MIPNAQIEAMTRIQIEAWESQERFRKFRTALRHPFNSVKDFSLKAFIAGMPRPKDFWWAVRPRKFLGLLCFSHPLFMTVKTAFVVSGMDPEKAERMTMMALVPPVAALALFTAGAISLTSAAPVAAQAGAAMKTAAEQVDKEKAGPVTPLDKAMSTPEMKANMDKIEAEFKQNLMIVERQQQGQMMEHVPIGGRMTEVAQQEGMVESLKAQTNAFKASSGTVLSAVQKAGPAILEQMMEEQQDKPTRTAPSPFVRTQSAPAQAILPFDAWKEKNSAGGPSYLMETIVEEVVKALQYAMSRSRLKIYIPPPDGQILDDMLDQVWAKNSDDRNFPFEAARRTGWADALKLIEYGIIVCNYDDYCDRLSSANWELIVASQHPDWLKAYYMKINGWEIPDVTHLKYFETAEKIRHNIRKTMDNDLVLIVNDGIITDPFTRSQTSFASPLTFNTSFATFFIDMLLGRRAIPDTGSMSDLTHSEEIENEDENLQILYMVEHMYDAYPNKPEEYWYVDEGEDAPVLDYYVSDQDFYGGLIDIVEVTISTLGISTLSSELLQHATQYSPKGLFQIFESGFELNEGKFTSSETDNAITLDTILAFYVYTEYLKSIDYDYLLGTGAITTKRLSRWPRM